MINKLNSRRFSQERRIIMKRYVLFSKEELIKIMNGEEIKHEISGDIGTLYFASKEEFTKSIGWKETDNIG